MNVKFYVRKSRKECKIIICIYPDRSNQLKLSTEHTIDVDQWDAKKQRAKKSMIGYEVLNQSLEKLKLEVLKHIRELKLQAVSTIFWLL